MNRIAALAALAALSSCQSVRLPPPTPLPSAAAPFAFDTETGLLKFHESWPAEVTAIAPLAGRIRSEMVDWQNQLLASAAADKASRDTQGFPFHRYEGLADWTVAGQTPRLLSLSRTFYEYTGGAHGNQGTRALLWDRAAASEIPFAGLFMQSAAPARLLENPWCKALDAERAKKRGPDRYGIDEFNRCPALSELAIIPADTDRDGRFETTLLVADPYVAGPYAEGNYEIRLPVSQSLIAALRPDYRASFEVQSQ